jgi:hypothetical protein
VVGLNGSGRIIKATTAAAAIGLVCLSSPKNAGDPVDVMQFGEIVEVDGADIQGGAAPTAGQKLYLDTTASRLTNVAAPTAGTNYFFVGQTAEATRLIVRCGLIQG